MPKGPQGQKRPADVIGAAVMVGRIATGEEVEVTGGKTGSAGGRARANSLSSFERSRIAAKAAKARWSQDESPDVELKMTELGLLKRELFGTPDSAISDIKFYPGEAMTASNEQIAGHIRRALQAVEDGNCRDIDLST
jgi:hypothetical protein